MNKAIIRKKESVFLVGITNEAKSVYKFLTPNTFALATEWESDMFIIYPINRPAEYFSANIFLYEHEVTFI